MFSAADAGRSLDKGKGRTIREVIDVDALPDLSTASTSSSSLQKKMSPPKSASQSSNAWILYRSDRLKDFGETNNALQQKPRKLMGLCDMIADMWHQESPGVRSMYGRQAALLSAIHQSPRRGNKGPVGRPPRSARKGLFRPKENHIPVEATGEEVHTWLHARSPSSNGLPHRRLSSGPVTPQDQFLLQDPFEPMTPISDASFETLRRDLATRCNGMSASETPVSIPSTQLEPSWSPENSFQNASSGSYFPTQTNAQPVGLPQMAPYPAPICFPPAPPIEPFPTPMRASGLPWFDMSTLTQRANLQEPQPACIAATQAPPFHPPQHAFYPQELPPLPMLSGLVDDGLPPGFGPTDTQQSDALPSQPESTNDTSTLLGDIIDSWATLDENDAFGVREDSSTMEADILNRLILGPEESCVIERSHIDTTPSRMVDRGVSPTPCKSGAGVRQSKPRPRSSRKK